MSKVTTLMSICHILKASEAGASLVPWIDEVHGLPVVLQRGHHARRRLGRIEHVADDGPVGLLEKGLARRHHREEGSARWAHRQLIGRDARDAVVSVYQRLLHIHTTTFR